MNLRGLSVGRRMINSHQISSLDPPNRSMKGCPREHDFLDTLSYQAIKASFYQTVCFCNLGSTVIGAGLDLYGVLSSEGNNYT